MARLEDGLASIASFLASDVARAEGRSLSASDGSLPSPSLSSSFTSDSAALSSSDEGSGCLPDAGGQGSADQGQPALLSAAAQAMAEARAQAQARAALGIQALQQAAEESQADEHTPPPSAGDAGASDDAAAPHDELRQPDDAMQVEGGGRADASGETSAVATTSKGDGSGTGPADSLMMLASRADDGDDTEDEATPTLDKQVEPVTAALPELVDAEDATPEADGGPLAAPHAAEQPASQPASSLADAGGCKVALDDSTQPEDDSPNSPDMFDNDDDDTRTQPRPAPPDPDPPALPAADDQQKLALEKTPERARVPPPPDEAEAEAKNASPTTQKRPAALPAKRDPSNQTDQQAAAAAAAAPTDAQSQQGAVRPSDPAVTQSLRQTVDGDSLARAQDSGQAAPTPTESESVVQSTEATGFTLKSRSRKRTLPPDNDSEATGGTSAASSSAAKHPRVSTASPQRSPDSVQPSARAATVRKNARPMDEAPQPLVDAGKVKLGVAFLCIKKAQEAGVTPVEWWSHQREHMLQQRSDAECESVSRCLTREALVSKVSWLRKEVRELKRADTVSSAKNVAADAAATAAAMVSSELRLPLRWNASAQGQPGESDNLRASISLLESLEETGATRLPPHLKAEHVFSALLKYGMDARTGGAGCSWAEVEPSLKCLLRLCPASTTAVEPAVRKLANLFAGMIASSASAAAPAEEVCHNAMEQLVRLGSFAQLRWVVLRVLVSKVLATAETLAQRCQTTNEGVDWAKVEPMFFVFEALGSLLDLNQRDKASPDATPGEGPQHRTSRRVVPRNLKPFGTDTS